MATKPKKKNKKNRSSSHRTLLLSILSISLFVFLGFIYYFVVYKHQNLTPIEDTIKHYSTKALLDDLSNIKTQEPTVIQKPKVVKTTVVVKRTTIEKTVPFVERGKEKKTDNKIAKTKKPGVLSHEKKPKLAIIIDDVHTKKQIEALKKLKLHITPSIFPPYVLSKHSNQLAKQVKHAMIHLPMESGSKQFNTQYKTLMTSFSDEKLADRAMELRTLFPNVTYVNNHTGSVFTSNYKAMKKLYIALKMEGFIFVDSLTSTSSKVRQIAHEFGDRYIKRDIVIDNIHTIKYIHNQLRKAVKKAKKKGYAIAIGHPHKTTIQALASSKKILKDVKLVYINEI